MPAPIKFSDEDKAYIVAEYKKGASVLSLASLFKNTSRTIKNVLLKSGVVLRVSNGVIGNEKQIIERYQNGESIESLAKAFSICTRYVRKAIAQAGIQQRTLCESNRRKKVNESFFDVIDTEAKAYFLGFMYADGCNRIKQGRFILGLQLRDLSILNEFCKYLNYEGKPVICSRLNKATLTIGSRRLSDALTRLGCTQAKTFTLRYPTFLSESMQHHFIRGFIDGDGCYYVGKRSIYISAIATSAFVHRLGEIISNNLNINCWYQLHGKTVGIEYVKIGGAKQCRKLVDYLYKDATIYLQRKKDKADLMLPVDRSGENCYLSVLTSESVLQIREQHKQGSSRKELASLFSVTKSTIDKIVTNQTWKTTM